jgi:hypothetical protein
MHSHSLSHHQDAQDKPMKKGSPFSEAVLSE